LFWIISGLIRYDENNPNGFNQPIPQKINVSDFLVGNPNVQNSNLFVRLEDFLSVGGYDEQLVSTTDRDISIRLLQNKVQYRILFNHLVHHDAFSRSKRLSQPGSTRKKKGLSRFYSKYAHLMNYNQKYEFKKRANEFFNIDLNKGGE